MKVYTVIHASDKEQIFRNLDRSLESGADGSFLINHAGISVEELLEATTLAKQRNGFESFYIGLNLLGVASDETFELAQSVQADGLWLDESYIRPHNRFDSCLAEIDKARKLFKGEYFGSVAFKTHEAMGFAEAAYAAAKAVNHVDVVTTSGVNTGQAPAVAKIVAMRAAIGRKRLAIASGITPDNVQLFLGQVDAVLVATGIQDSWTELNPSKIKQLVKNSR